jgi:hypothetical protein
LVAVVLMSVADSLAPSVMLVAPRALIVALFEMTTFVPLWLIKK